MLHTEQKYVSAATIWVIFGECNGILKDLTHQEIKSFDFEDLVLTLSMCIIHLPANFCFENLFLVLSMFRRI